MLQSALASCNSFAGVAHALGRLRLLEVGEQLADVAKLADVAGAHAPGDPTACPEKVREDRNFVTDGFSKSSAGRPGAARSH
jgi:hypothetical protein